mgnify:CR=1 FL=1|jgi:hypothetical protein
MYTKEQIKKAIDDEIIYGDGHTIMAPDYYEGFDVSSLIQVYKSDTRSGKSTIFKDGEVVEEVEGVYNLSFLYHVATMAGVRYRDCMGRGTQARIIVDALKEWSDDE